MDPRARHERLNELFAQAIALPPGERPAFVKTTATEDSQIAADLDRLLRFHQETTVIAKPTESKSADQPLHSRCTRYCRKCGLIAKDDAEIRCSVDQQPLVVAFEGARLIDGKYRAERRIGGGGMGEVFLAFHLGLERHFALKLIRKQAQGADLAAWFASEAKALGRLEHPNIVNVTDYGCDPRGLPYLVMEFLPGIPLDVAMESRKRLQLVEALPLFRALANAIDFAHSKGVLHCDLKPANILLPLKHGEPDLSQPKIVDFGIAHLLDSSSRREAAGTPAYMAPELFRNEPPSPASDRFAFGVMIYRLLTGEFPFGDFLPAITAYKKPCAKPSSIAPVPGEADEVILRAIDVDAAKRPAGAGRIVDQLEWASQADGWRRWKREQLPKRIAAGCSVALVTAGIALLLSELPMLRAAEASLVDLRFHISRPLSPSGRIVLISVDEASLTADPRPLAERGGEFGEILEAFVSAGAARIGIDLLLPPQWGNAPAFARFLVPNASKVTMAAYQSADGTIGLEALGSFGRALLADRAYSLFKLANVSPDDDGVVRRGGTVSPSFAAAVAGVDSPEYPIDFRFQTDLFQRLSWKDAGREVTTRSERFRNKLVLVGAEYSGSGDLYNIPSTSGRKEISGLVLQALMAETLLAGTPIHKAASWVSVAAGACTGVIVAVLLLSWPAMWRGLVPAIVATLFYLVCGLLLFREYGLQVNLSIALLTSVLSLMVAVYLRIRVFPPIPLRVVRP